MAKERDFESLCEHVAALVGIYPVNKRRNVLT